jgi:hypothetical protein
MSKSATERDVAVSKVIANRRYRQELGNDKVANLLGYKNHPENRRPVAMTQMSLTVPYHVAFGGFTAFSSRFHFISQAGHGSASGEGSVGFKNSADSDNRHMALTYR